MAGVWVALAGLALSAASTGYAIASAPKPPGSPDLARATRAGVEAESATLADRRGLEAAAQQGGKYTYTDPAHKESRQFIKVPIEMTQQQSIDRGHWDAATAAVLPGGQMEGFHFADFMGLGPGKQYKLVPYVKADWEKGGQFNKDGKLDQAWIDKHTRMRDVKVPTQTKTADFSGHGEADVQGALARGNAANALALGDKYGVAFAEEGRKQLEQSDPEGFAAREKAYELIQKQIEEHPDRPVAKLLDEQVSKQLAAGNGLDSVSSDVLNDAVRASLASRGDTSSADFADPLTTGSEGRARGDAGRRKALAWLTSGATPEDVQYRREQQNLANLGAFVDGQSPESQFQNLSGAQNGAAPNVPGRPLPGQNPNAGPAMAGAQTQGWNTAMGQAGQQANPWMAGLSMLIRGAGAAGAGGWRPLATNV